jgi:hypothetical protein
MRGTAGCCAARSACSSSGRLSSSRLLPACRRGEDRLARHEVATVTSELTLEIVDQQAELLVLQGESERVARRRGRGGGGGEGMRSAGCCCCRRCDRFTLDAHHRCSAVATSSSSSCSSVQEVLQLRVDPHHAVHQAVPAAVARTAGRGGDQTGGDASEGFLDCKKKGREETRMRRESVAESNQNATFALFLADW